MTRGQWVVLSAIRYYLLRGGIVVVALAVLWFCTARWCSLLLDRIYTAPLATLPSNPIGWNGTWLQFGASLPDLIGPKGWNGPDLLEGAHILDLSGPGPDYAPVAELQVNAEDQLVLVADGHRFVFGSRAGTLPGDDKPVPAFAADPGDATSVTLRRSLLSWPTPFDVNFMTGQSPSWVRHLYYRLYWTKANGARLDMLWQGEQGWDAVNGWHATGAALIRVEIRPAAR